MPRERPQRRDEPRLLGKGKSRARDSGLRGERLDVASSEEDVGEVPERRGREWRTSRGDENRRGESFQPRLRDKEDDDDRGRRRLGRHERILRSDRAETGSRASAPRKRRSRLGWVLRWSATLAIWAFVALAGIVAYYGYDLPETNLAELTRRPSITLLGDDGQSFATYGDLYYDVVPLKEMPPYLPEAVIATEDRRFYEHFGVDPFGILRALFEDLRYGQIRQGGSTITQQLAKNLFLTPDRTIKRKVQEVLLALWLEHKFTKDQILTIYLNRVYMGAGTYGVEAAAHKYFGKSARNVNLFEAAVLAGLLKAPSRFNPAANPDLTAQRAAQVLQNMVDAGFLTPEKAAMAAKSREELRPVASAAWRGRYFADWAMDQVRELVGDIDRDLVVKTTFDPRLQQLAEEAVASALDKSGEKLDIGQGALVALGPNGEVKAMVGGRDYRTSPFNRAVQALRQPGSSFKPFVYLAGLEAGYSPDSQLNDVPISYGNWHPRNYDNKFFGEVTLRQALAHSLNSATIQLAQKVGIKRVIDVAHRLGITSELRDDASIALGTSEVSLLELTGAYGSFADGGRGVWPYGILEIRDRNGQVLYKRNGSGPGEVMTPRDAAVMVDMMSGVITSGTGRAAAIGRPEAGKTGTTEDYRDAWFIGFTPDLIAGVWVGNDDGAPMKRVTGGTVPAQIWHNFMLAALKDTPPHDFAKPPTVLESVLQSLLGSSSGARSAATSPSARSPSPSGLPNGLFKVNQ